MQNENTAIFSEKELHCLARLLQTVRYEQNIFDGCTFCLYQCRTEKDPAPNFDKIMEKMAKLTGVNLSPSVSCFPFSEFPYRNFLKNSNEEAKERFRNYFKKI